MKSDLLLELFVDFRVPVSHIDVASLQGPIEADT